MNNDIFRKKSIDQLQSPDSLNDYIRVSNPGVWMLLTSVLILLLGMAVWGIFGEMEDSTAAQMRVDEGKIQLVMDPTEVGKVQEGIQIRTTTATYQVTKVADLNEPKGMCIVEMDGEFDDGVYLVDVVMGKIRPIYFIMN